MENLSHIKTYILGLLVGGGRIDKNTFVIDLPFKKWGMETRRMNVIAREILTKISEYFNSSYGFHVDYEIGNGKWLIKPVGNSDLSAIKEDLKYLGLPPGGFLLSNVDLSIAKTKLSGINAASFLSGIFDTRASLTLSHRRFINNAPVVSIEIPGSTRNFRFVVQLCSWLTDLGSITDQILYNHPNQHAASDPDYKGWKKGFKIRFLVKSFLTQHSFALQAKSVDVIKIEKHQSKEEQIPCYLRKLKRPGPVTVHSDQNSGELPLEVRNKIFFHYHHFCAVLNCPHAPVDEIKKLIKESKSLISFFPRLSKGNKIELTGKLKRIQSDYFPEMEISSREIRVKGLIHSEYFEPFHGLDQGIAFLFAQTLHGKRHVGSMDQIINQNLENTVVVKIIGESYDSSVLIINPDNDRAFICSSVSNNLNQQLIKSQIQIKDLTVKLKQ